MDISIPDPCKKLKDARYRLMEKFDLCNGKATVGYTDQSLVVFIKDELEIEIPDVFEGFSVHRAAV